MTTLTDPATGKTFEVEPYMYDDVDIHAAPGPGRFAFEVTKYGPAWYYKAPNGPWKPVGIFAAQPPYPRPRGQRGTVCGACGQPYWHESRGNGYGFCDYCYYAG